MFFILKHITSNMYFRDPEKITKTIVFMMISRSPKLEH